MCLAIPGKVIETFDQAGMRMGKIQFGGIVREACLEYVPETQVGEYVLVHVGFAMSKISEDEALDQLRVLTMLGEQQAAMEEVQGYGLNDA